MICLGESRILAWLYPEVSPTFSYGIPPRGIKKEKTLKGRINEREHFISDSNVGRQDTDGGASL